MSYTEIFGFNKEGNACWQADIANSWRGSMAIWSILEERYLPPYIPNYIKSCNWYYPDISFEEVAEKMGYSPSRTTSMFEKNNPIKEIWDLVEDEKVSLIDKIVLMTTFDMILVKRDDIPKVVDAFNQFVGETSLKEQSNVLQKFCDNPDCIAVGWNQTSVNADNWGNFNYDEKAAEYYPYNCLTQNEHFWLFDELDN